MVLLSTLPEYEPPVLGEHEPPWSTPAPRPERRVVELSWTRADAPVRDEPGAARNALWRLMTLLLEALDGRRPLAQLRGAMDAPVYEAMLTRVRVSGGSRHRLLSLHTCRVGPGAVELCASVRVWATCRPDGWRGMSVAGRVELVGGTWRCTALRPLLPGTVP
ncbi:Rv3235 family protein [Actinokineospora sp.]|uniref:Rv3235 family protein n=1 Tax=Actinokineospora sp. TaxID=1872133 RepID=UPI0040383214